MLDIEGVKRFHGHWCPGLAIGIRVAEVALREIGSHSEDEEIVAIVETGNCAVDAIQYLVGCTFGKGNLIHLDYGKNAFTFIRRSDGKAIRIVVRPGRFGEEDSALADLARKARQGQATEAEREQLRQARIRQILERPGEAFLDVQAVEAVIPAPARIYSSIICAGCGEQVMETRARLLDGQTYCLPCFEHRQGGSA